MRPDGADNVSVAMAIQSKDMLMVACKWGWMESKQLVKVFMVRAKQWGYRSRGRATSYVHAHKWSLHPVNNTHAKASSASHGSEGVPPRLPPTLTKLSGINTFPFVRTATSLWQ